MSGVTKKKAITVETFIVLILLLAAFAGFSFKMGIDNFMNTFINLAYSLLMNVALWIMAVAVLTSAIGAIMAEFGVFSLLNKVLAPVTKVIYSLPGVSAFGAISAYMSDNPAVISLSKENEFRKQFKPYQIPVLCNVGTSFGMGMVILITMFTMAQKASELIKSAIENNSNPTNTQIIYKIMDPNYFDKWNFMGAALIGLLAAVIGSAVSVRLLNNFSKKYNGIKYDPKPIKEIDDEQLYREVREGNALNRFLESALDGGKNGVEIGLQIIPGILIIATLVMILSNPQPAYYTGAITDGVGLLSWLFTPFEPVLQFIFGISSPEAVSFPLTSLGSAGAAVGLIPNMLVNEYIGLKEIAVFTAMGTVWSGYLSTHISMMDSLGARKLAGKAILAHTIGGLVAGIAANILFEIIMNVELAYIIVGSAILIGVIVFAIIMSRKYKGVTEMVYIEDLQQNQTN